MKPTFFSDLLCRWERIDITCIFRRRKSTLSKTRLYFALCLTIKISSRTMSKSKYYQKYKDDYHLEWPCVGKSTKGEYYAFCTVCGADISIKSGGRNDVFRHITSDKHKQTAKARGNTKGIQSFFRLV